LFTALAIPVRRSGTELSTVVPIATGTGSPG